FVVAKETREIPPQHVRDVAQDEVRLGTPLDSARFELFPVLCGSPPAGVSVRRILRADQTIGRDSQGSDGAFRGSNVYIVDLDPPLGLRRFIKHDHVAVAGKSWVPPQMDAGNRHPRAGFSALTHAADVAADPPSAAG